MTRAQLIQHVIPIVAKADAATQEKVARLLARNDSGYIKCLLANDLYRLGVIDKATAKECQ